MSEKVPNMHDYDGSNSGGFFGALSLVLGGALLVRVGYDLGIGQAKKILKQHDKDVRKMDKREKRIYREQRKKEREKEKIEKRGERVHNRWFGFNKTTP